MEDPGVLEVVEQYGIALSNAGKYQASFDIFELTLKIRKEILGESHLDTLTSVHRLAYRMDTLGRYEEVLKLREEVLSRRRELWAENHPDTITAMASLAVSFDLLGKHEEAFKLKEEVLSKRTELLGEDHPNIISDLNSFAWTCYLWKNAQYYDKALTCAKRAVQLSENYSDQKQYILSADTLAHLYLWGDTKDAESAAALGDKLLALAQKFFADNKSFLAERYYACAIFRQASGDESALAYADKAFKLRSEVFGVSHPETIEAKKLAEEIAAQSR